MAKNIKKNKNNTKQYNAENEIIIGVTTKPKEKERVEKKKTTRKSSQSVQKKVNKESNNKTKKTTVRNKTVPKKKVSNNGKAKTNKTKKEDTKTNANINKLTNYTEETKEEIIKKINAKKIIVSIFILLFIALCGTIYYLTTPAFNISNIEVYGNDKNTVDTYISLSKINIGTTNIFAVTQNSIRKNIKENPYVEEVTIQRKLPNTLQINITERKVTYQVEYSNSYIYIDEQGYILEISEEKKDILLINGFSTIKNSIEPGQRLIEEDLIKLNVVAKVTNYCKYNTIENKITSIDVTDDTNYILYFKEDKKTVYLGDASNLSERLSLLKTILKNEKNKQIEIFMNGDLNKDNVYIRYSE